MSLKGPWGARPHSLMMYKTGFSQLFLSSSMLSAPQGPKLWPEENSHDQELAAVLVSWTVLLIPGHFTKTFSASAVLANPCLPEFKPQKLFISLRSQSPVLTHQGSLPLLLLQESLTFEDDPAKKARPEHPLGKRPFLDL